MDEKINFKILVVGYAPELPDVPVRSLKKAGYKLFTAADGNECMKVIKKSRPDLILLDVMLPDINGLDLCKKIKNNPEFSSVYIILFSTLKTRSDQVSAGLEEGADGYISRPVSDRELLARVEAARRTIIAENKVKANQMLLEACIDSPPDMIVLAIDKQFNYLAYNTYHKEVMLQAYGKVIKPGMNLIECMTSQEDIYKAKINYGRAFNGESHTSIEEYGHIDRQYYETRYNPIYYDKNEIIGATAFASNVTKRKQMEDTLMENERLLRESQSIAGLGSYVWNLVTDTWRSSEVLDEIFGIDEHYVRTLDGWKNIIHPEWQDLMSEYVINDVLGNRQKFDKEYLIIRQSDRVDRWVHGLGELEYDINNNPVKLIGTISDITERKNLEVEIKKLNAELELRVVERTSQLEAVNKELQAFAYSVSHDLRAPLRAIDGFSKFVIEDYGSKLDSEGKRLLGLIRDNAKKMDQLITDILALSRVTSSEHKLSKVDMTRMAISMFNETASPEIREKISFVIDTIPDANVDPTFMKLVWMNLISNAIKFSSLKEAPEINIGASTSKGFNVYYVKDNGVGFNPEYSHKLFRVFQRLHKPDDFEGTGVGLAIVQRIIQRHGGKVWAESSEGQGATFFFSIPVHKSV
jgi:signal transduction histidine kinase/DNA-binding response OmpR family regulator